MNKILIGFAIIFNLGFGQTSKYSFSSLTNTPPILDSNHKIEIRIVADEAITSVLQCVWVFKSDTQWVAKTYLVDEARKHVNKSSSKKLGNSWSSRLQEILTSEIWSFKNQEEIIENHRKSLEVQDKYFLVKDGTNYQIEIKDGEQYRLFLLHSPSSYLKEIPDSKELKFFSDLLRLVDKNVKAKLG